MPYYTVSQDKKGMWYVHQDGHPKVPVLDTFRKSRTAALQAAAELMGMSYGQYMLYRQKQEAKK